MNILEDKNILSPESKWGKYKLVIGNTEWEDSTSYSRGTKKLPTTFKLKLNDYYITINCGHRYYPNIWIMHCHALGISEFICKDCVTATQAANFAIKVVRTKLTKMLESLNEKTI